MEEGAEGSGGTVDCVGVILVIAGQVPQSHFFNGGPAILQHHKQATITAGQAWSLFRIKLKLNHLFYRGILLSFTQTFLSFLPLF